VPGPFREQAELTFANLRAVVEGSGGRMERTVKASVYLVDMGDFPELNAVWMATFPDPRPARTTVQSDLPGFLIEVDLIVALDEPA
jgi:enamine deaminase RidA (YjgF/YER057c/UK114 family)